MKKIRTFFSKLGWGKTKIRSQMYAVYAGGLFVPLLVVGLVLIFSGEKMLNDHYTELLEADNRRVKTLLSEITTQAYNISQEVYFDNGLKKVLSDDYETTTDFVRAVNTYGTLDELVYNAMEIEGVYIYTDNPSAKNYKQYRAITEEIAEADWYNKALETTNAFWVSIREESYSTDNSNLCLARKLGLTDSKYHAVVLVKISDSYLRSRLDTSSIIDAVSIGDQGIVYSTKRNWYGQEQPVEIDFTESYFRYSGRAEAEDTAYFATVSTIHLYNTSSKMYICTLDSSGIQAISRIMSTWILLLLFAILIPGIVLLVFADYFARRVDLLREEMHKARLQDYNIISQFSGRDELKDAFEDLKFMVQDIKAKDAKMYEAELNEKELRNKQQLMEFKMLAHQINPHYLYNTLETIRMKALTSGNRDVADSIKILGKTLHYVLENTGTTFTTLEKELDHVRNYLKIQKMRFGERINYIIEIEPELDPRAYTILPLLLQPVVENAVVHGLESINGPGLIRIDIATVNRQLHIIVTDNGKGMSEAEVERIRGILATPDLQLQSGIALYNIHQRIRLRYGEGYGIRLESKLDLGTLVVLELPAESPENIG